MGQMGFNGWMYWTVGRYLGKGLALPICIDCEYLVKAKEGSRAGTIEEFFYECHADTSSAAAKMAMRKDTPSNCGQYRQAKSKDKESSKSSHGGGFGASAGQNILSGLGQLTNAVESPDDLIGGVGKIGLGTLKIAGKGLALAGKGIAAGIKAAKEDAAKDAAEQEAEEEKANAYLQQINSLSVTGDSDDIVQSLSELLSIIKWESEWYQEDQDNVRDAASEKIKLGIIELTNLGDTVHAEHFQECFENTDWFKEKKRAAEMKARTDAMKAKSKEMLVKGATATAEGAKKLFGSIKEKIKGKKEDKTETQNNEDK